MLDPVTQRNLARLSTAATDDNAVSARCLAYVAEQAKQRDNYDLPPFRPPRQSTPLSPQLRPRAIPRPDGEAKRSKAKATRAPQPRPAAQPQPSKKKKDDRDQERQEILEARKQKRRTRALARGSKEAGARLAKEASSTLEVRDRSRSHAAVLKDADRRKRRKTGRREVKQDDAGGHDDDVSMKRTRKAVDKAKLANDTRPSSSRKVGQGRLTVMVPTTIGLFNKGAASRRLSKHDVERLDRLEEQPACRRATPVFSESRFFAEREHSTPSSSSAGGKRDINPLPPSRGRPESKSHRCKCCHQPRPAQQEEDRYNVSLSAPGHQVQEDLSISSRPLHHATDTDSELHSAYSMALRRRQAEHEAQAAAIRPSSSGSCSVDTAVATLPSGEFASGRSDLARRRSAPLRREVYVNDDEPMHSAPPRRAQTWPHIPPQLAFDAHGKPAQHAPNAYRTYADDVDVDAERNTRYLVRQLALHQYRPVEPIRPSTARLGTGATEREARQMLQDAAPARRSSPFSRLLRACDRGEFSDPILDQHGLPHLSHDQLLLASASDHEDALPMMEEPEDNIREQPSMTHQHVQPHLLPTDEAPLDPVAWYEVEPGAASGPSSSGSAQLWHRAEEFQGAPALVDLGRDEGVGAMYKPLEEEPPAPEPPAHPAPAPTDPFRPAWLVASDEGDKEGDDAAVAVPAPSDEQLKQFWRPFRQSAWAGAGEW